jgi:pantoate--beta-alanine ligase
MKVVRTARSMKRLAESLRPKQTIGLVPTMGALHAGHAELVRASRRLTDVTVVSIFLNPMQFGPGEDLARYPRNLAADRAMLRGLGVNVLFLPSVAEMYPHGFCSYVNVERLTAGLCGASRQHHFRGVTTVVAKLFNIVKPNVAVFGRKDYQQLVVVRRFVRDLNFDVRIVAMPTVREQDGLAMSSRNAYLSPDARSAASELYQALRTARRAVSDGELRAARLIDLVRTRVEASGARVDYVELVDAEELRPLRRLDGPAVLAVAAFLGGTRLIDNISLGGRRGGRSLHLS